MKCLITKTSSYEYREVKVFKDLDALKEFVVRHKKCVIKTPYEWEGEVDLTLEIYDTWRE